MKIQEIPLEKNTVLCYTVFREFQNIHRTMNRQCPTGGRGLPQPNM